MYSKIFLIICISFLFQGCNLDSKKLLLKEKDSLSNLLKESRNNNLGLNDRIQLIDSAFSISQELPLDSLHLAIISQKSNLHFKLKQKDSAFIYDNYLAEKALKLFNKYYLSRANLNIALYFNEIQNFDEAFKHFNISKNYFLQLKDSSRVGRQLMSMGLIQKNQNDFFGSKETITEAIQYLHPKKDLKYISSSYSALATNHRKLLNYPDALKYYNKAIKTTDSPKDKLIYQNNLATTYIDNQQYNDAISFLKSISTDSLLVKNQKEYPRVMDNLAYAQWLFGKEIKVKAFLVPLKIRKQNNDKRGQIASYTHLGEFYNKVKSKKAVMYFDSVIQLSKNIKMPSAEKDALKFLMKLQPQNVALRDRYVLLQDSLYAQELKVKTQFAKYKYDDKRKQESILRLEKENTERELEASQQRNQKIIYLGGLIFITSIFGLSLYGFRQRTKRLKQKSKVEKLEAIHETEAQLSQKLHDDHGGKLNTIMALIQRNEDKSIVLDNIETIYNQTRDFSRELNWVDTGPNYWSSLKATLEYAKPIEVEMTLNGGKELKWSLVSNQTKTILFKVLQELVINMTRHSYANQTVILFRDQKKELSIYYEDDGVGASKEALLRKNGLRNTEKRIKAIDGSITFDSEKEKGFRAKILIPK